METDVVEIDFSGSLNLTDPKYNDFDLILFVEEIHHETIVKSILASAGFEISKIEIIVLENLGGISQTSRTKIQGGHQQQQKGTLYSAEISISEKFRELQKQIDDKQLNLKLAVLFSGNLDNLPNLKSIHVFFAVPNVEAWLFAANTLPEQLHLTADDKALKKIKTILTPANLSERRDLQAAYSFDLKEEDITRLMARSKSLRDFLTGIAELLETSLANSEEYFAKNLSRQIFVSLINEVTPADTVVWRISGGYNITARKLATEIEQGSDLGKQYISDVLRIVRDMLARQARED